MAVTEVSATSSKRRSATSYARVLFETLTKVIAAATGDESELAENHLAVIEALPELYQCFLHQNRCITNAFCFFL